MKLQNKYAYIIIQKIFKLEYFLLNLNLKNIS